jgi:sulfotransferase
MKRFGVLCGLPRSGSTLLCSILNQHPRIYASSTSPLPYVVSAASAAFTNAPETKSELLTNPDTDARVNRAVDGLVRGWYGDEHDVVIDKGRWWGSLSLQIKAIYPDAPIICCVRDPRAVFGSIEKQHAKNPLLDDANSPQERTQYARADRMFSPEGIVGQCIVYVEDLLRRRPKNLTFVEYEALVADPAATMRRLYADIVVEPHEHDFENITCTAIDADGLYLNKFPHTHEQTIEMRESDWSRYLASDLAGVIITRYPGYCRAFGYV